MVKTVKAVVTMQLKPIIESKTVLVTELTEEEVMWEWLLGYMQSYHCPEWFEVAEVKVDI